MIPRQRCFALVLGVLVCGVVEYAVAADGVQDVELAGLSRADYPFFQYVHSIGPGSDVHVAIDPTRFPGIMGDTCDVYVVAARSAAEWSADPSLLDVTPGGAQTESFGGATIQANDFTVTLAGELSADAGAGLGVGYDVVLDCNRNGLLDAGDYADGGGDEAGFYTVHDPAQPGPLSTTSVSYGDGQNILQIVYYPVDIGGMGQLPLVVISHGWTHDYLWYDHIGQHLASYGYLVMSHQNDVGDGGPAATETASTATLDNIDYLLANQATLPAIDGHIDSSRIVLIGHSTGGEGVVRAYTRLRTGNYVPQHFGAPDIVLLAPIAPVAWHDPSTVDPFDVNFHMFAGAADLDTSNAPIDNYVQLLTIYERSTGNKQLTYIQGVGHADFHNGTQPSGDWATGPDLLGRAATHPIVKGYHLPLMELYLRNNPAARDFFARMDDDLRPAGIGPGVVIANEYRAATTAGDFVIDDYQQNFAHDVSSSGGAVTFNVLQVAETRLSDQDSSFDWDGTQPQNGMTRARYPADLERGVVFLWATASRYYELEIVPTQRDLTDDGFLSFRVAQGTRHPVTVSLGAALTFTVALRDGNGTESSIWFGSYGEITQPYQRTGFGSGAGWANEFSTVRLRLTDFLNNGSGLDLTDVVAVRFEFGDSPGSSRGRIGLDDVRLTDREAPAPFVVTMEKTGSSSTLRWPATAQGLGFHVYRGTLPISGVYDHTCFEADDALGDGAFVSADATPIPVDRAGFYYLVSELGPGGEGSLGGTPERPNDNPCP